MSTTQKNWVRKKLFTHCDVLGVGLWSCPSFIFLVMGVVIICTILTTYVIAEQHADPEVVIAIVVALTIFLLVITQVLVAAFERVVHARQLEAIRSKEVLELKDQFVYLAVHDLAAAATAVKWGLKMIESEMNKTLSEDDQEIFESIRTRNEQLVDLVHQILLITKIEREQVEITLESVSPSVILNDAINDNWTKQVRPGTECECGILDTLPTILTDKGIFLTIMNTLLSNARTHASPEGGKLSISARVENPSLLFITVANNGEGIAPELQKHIFEKFWRNKETGRIERAGFGLYIAQSLANVLGGNITFTSDQDITRFILCLPLQPYEKLSH